MTELPPYQYQGARALVELHDRYLREFVEVWKDAKANHVVLPETEDPAYESLEHLLRHLCAAARGYMVWMCEQLSLPDPGIRKPPPAEELPAQLEEYVEHVLESWKTPLAGVFGERFEDAHYTTRWGASFTIDGMLEHAVMHPIRHSFQLRKLMSHPLS